MSHTARTHGDAPMPRLLIALATYNEVDNLRPLVEEIAAYAPHASVLIVDDNSPDGTGELADDLRAEMGHVDVIHRRGKLGLGSATLEGMRHAIDGGYDLFLTLDADFSHPPRFIPALLAGMRDHDVMIGSRYVPGGGIEGGFGPVRRLMSFGINGYARAMLGLTTRDNSGAFRCYRVSQLARVDFGRFRSSGYSYLEEILYLCLCGGCRIGETPIRFEDRRAGVSKINRGEVVQALRILTALGLERLTGRGPLPLPRPSPIGDRAHGLAGPHARVEIATRAVEAVAKTA